MGIRTSGAASMVFWRWSVGASAPPPTRNCISNILQGLRIHLVYSGSVWMIPCWYDRITNSANLQDGQSGRMLRSGATPRTTYHLSES